MKLNPDSDGPKFVDHDEHMRLLSAAYMAGWDDSHDHNNPDIDYTSDSLSGFNKFKKREGIE